MSALCIEFLSRLLGVIQNVNRSWQERCFFLHSQKINPPGIYEGNSPEIFDAVTFSKVCEQAGCNSLKVSKFQNEFMKSSFLPKYERKIDRIFALCSEGRNPDNFSFVFWEKR